MIGKEPVGVSLSLFYNAIKDKSRRKVNCAKNTGGIFHKGEKPVIHS